MEVPVDAAAAGFMGWCASTFAAHPDDIRRRFSMALLLVLFDAWWWQNCAPPPDPEKVEVSSTREVFGFLAALGCPIGR